MNYIVYKRYHGKTFSGSANLPYNTPLSCKEGILYYNDEPICFVTSQVAHEHFARNDDGQGIKRGQLTTSILKQLKKHDIQHDARWPKVWDDPICLKYKRPEFEDFFRFNHNFYIAPIEDLEHIAKLIGVKI